MKIASPGKATKINKSLFIAAFSALTLSLYEAVMGWVWVLFACSIVISIYKVFVYSPPIKNFTINLLAVFCIAVLAWLASGIGLLYSMINLMVIACCLKLINLHSKRDFQLIAMTAFFLVACGVIFHQSLLSACLYVVLVFTLLNNVHALEIANRNTRFQIANASKLLLQAAPITVILFFVVPRLPPLWQVPMQASSQTGINDKISPGDIANLAQSTDLVFRAEFKGDIPAANSRYWRTLVLDRFDGHSWYATEQNNVELSIDPSLLNGEALSYKIIAEPSGKPWLYSLDLPVIVAPGNLENFRMDNHYALSSDTIISTQSFYQVDSYPDTALNLFDQFTERGNYLAYPKEKNTRTQALVDSMVTDKMSAKEIITTLNGIFNARQFSYSLSPPLMRIEAIDQFMFEYKQGFCSHYASALAFMLRVAGVPARMVAGYQGGELQSDRLMSIYQYDAHAWVEAYIDGQGWVRVDPTNNVAPERIMAGLRAALNERPSILGEAPVLFNTLHQSALFQQLRYFAANIDFIWTSSILGFDQSQQLQLFSGIVGDITQTKISLLMFAAVTLIALILWAIYLSQAKTNNNTVRQELIKLDKILLQIGFPRSKGETLQNYHQRVQSELPDKAQKLLHEFVDEYYQARYFAIHNEYNERQLSALIAFHRRKLGRSLRYRPSTV